MDWMIHVQLTGTLTKIMTQVDPNRYEKYIIYENGLPVVYMRLKRHFMVPSKNIYYFVRTSLGN